MEKRRHRVRVLDIEVSGPGPLGEKACQGRRDGHLVLRHGMPLRPRPQQCGRVPVLGAEACHDADEVSQRLLAVLLLEDRLDPGRQLRPEPLPERLEHGIPALEVEVESALGDARLAGDLLDRGRSDPAPTEHGLSRVENLVTPITGTHLTKGQCSLAKAMTEGSRRLLVVPGHPVDTLAWVGPDLLQRLLPFAALTLLVGFAFHPRWLGLGLGEVRSQLLFGLLVAPVMFALALPLQLFLSRRRGAIRVPDGPDAVLQGGYYVLNAACEEGFFRGLLQGGLSVLFGAPAAFLAATAAYVLYHRLGRWAWADVFATALAGVPLGLAFWLLPGPPSLLGVALAHVGATCGFLGPGPYLLRRLRFV